LLRDVGDIPVLKPRDVTTILEQLGFEQVRQKGSHKQFRHTDGRATTVPFHAGVTSHPFFSAALPLISGLRWPNSCGTGDPTRNPPRGHFS
jgi:predicted RNA binding protein YcfA (HicA-like mRNA interferase family)